MKKHIYIRWQYASLSLLFALTAIVTSCQSEPEIGSSLYPDNNKDNQLMAFVDNGIYNRKNFMSTTLVQAGNMPKIEVPTDTLRFNVRLTQPADRDLTFYLKVDETKIPTYLKSTHRPLPADAVNMLNSKVIVKKGQMQGSQPFVATLNNMSKTLINLKEDDKGLIPLTINTNDMVAISNKYNSYCWEVGKQVFWVNPKGTVDKLTPIPVTNYEVITNTMYGSVGEELSDGNTTTFARYLISDRDIDMLSITLKQPTEITAIQLTPMGFFFGEYLNLCFMKKIEILGSVDGTTFTSMGVAQNTNKPKGPQNVWNIVFYASQKVKTIRIRTFSTFQSNMPNQAVFLSELRLFR